VKYLARLVSARPPFTPYQNPTPLKNPETPERFETTVYVRLGESARARNVKYSAAPRRRSYRSPARIACLACRAEHFRNTTPPPPGAERTRQKRIRRGADMIYAGWSYAFRTTTTVTIRFGFSNDVRIVPFPRATRDNNNNNNNNNNAFGKLNPTRTRKRHRDRPRIIWYTSSSWSVRNLVTGQTYRTRDMVRARHVFRAIRHRVTRSEPTRCASLFFRRACLVNESV